MKGNITLVGKDRKGQPKWQLKYDLQRGADGKRKTAYATAHGSKADARAKLRELMLRVDRREHPEPSKLTLAEWCKEYLDRQSVGDGDDQLKPRTFEGYEQLLTRHVREKDIGKIRLQRLSTADIREWKDELRKSGRVAKHKTAPAGLSDMTVRHALRALHVCLQEAVDCQLLTSNPAANTGSKRKKDRAKATAAQAKINAFSKAECAKLLEGARPNPDQFAIIALGLATGARRGELLGLRWADVDFDRRTLTIARSVGIARKKIIVGTTKTGVARSIALFSDTLAVLKAHRNRYQEIALQLGFGRLPDNALIFPCLLPRQKGRQPKHQAHWHPTAITKDFARLAKRCGLHGHRFHDLRHTHATHLLEAGVPVHEVADRLGHSTPTTTLAIYADVLKGMKSRAGEAADAFLRSVLNGGSVA